ncbi:MULTISPECIES: adenylate/guanylate cyclase domain-containing protein [unclassified Ruegeria]|uniref:adenylate/guanylate cyclase domain-containing protein n=1 Tax=unclassified Ruegeria TaxID=2625375 RepID=UPI0014895E1B|nr:MULTISPECIES: adenylate/guanylate cyclase domain-containing protein [unclassified Ruegeria]
MLPPSHEPDPIENKVDALIEWMVDGARPAANAVEIIEGICTRLLDAGVAIDRFGLFIWTLHPNLTGRRFLWKAGAGVDRFDAPSQLFTEAIYTQNPLPHVIERQQSIRRHLEDPNCPEDYIIVGELREQGFTDYLAQPLIYINGDTHVCTWSSASPGGFSERDLAILNRVRGPLARLTETYMLRLDATYLLSTYVGRNSGAQILDGKVHRGDGSNIEAVILFADLKGFTRLSNSISGDALVKLLNDTFDCLVPSVMDQGGEILKFMGDGFFSIFPTHENLPPRTQILAAIKAVNEGLSLLDEADFEHKLGVRTAIHHGRFHYGNIGGGHRLDFTAIGPDVNLTARLVSAATELDCDHVLSETAAAFLPKLCKPVGVVPLKGFGQDQTVWEMPALQTP